jgi:hypothetical protein
MGLTWRGVGQEKKDRIKYKLEGTRARKYLHLLSFHNKLKSWPLIMIGHKILKRIREGIQG